MKSKNHTQLLNFVDKFDKLTRDIYKKGTLNKNILIQNCDSIIYNNKEYSLDELLNKNIDSNIDITLVFKCPTLSINTTQLKKELK